MFNAIKWGFLVGILGAVLMGCGRAEIEPQFQPYVDAFMADAKAHGQGFDVSQVTIKFGDTLSTENGAVCHTGNKEIDISRSSWSNGDDIDHKLMVYHELGHCVMGLGHIEGMGIMHSNRIPGVVFNLQPEVYLNQFFNR